MRVAVDLHARDGDSPMLGATLTPMRTLTTRAALVLGIVGGLVIIGLAALLVGAGRPSATAVATASAAPTLAAAATTGTAGPSTAASVEPSSTAVGAVTLVAAGDITSCAVTSDSATAKLVESIPGTVAALGDDAYDSGAPREFSQCYAPTWAPSWIGLARCRAITST